ncbi:MAG: TetR/AcrR family transcriptional regulator [Betaproteobacteria bacterium]|nr:TetR/AcrR family transcriptional regulator [Betaproteobacteria bacterium]
MAQQEEKKRRGRPRAYDTEQALAQATRAFWRTGFSGTSLDDLSAMTGMNRPSLYGAFGDKRALYLTTLEGYIARGRRGMEEALDFDRPLQEVLMRVYDGALSLYMPEKGMARGCFLIGTAATEAVGDAEIRSKLAEGLREFDRALEARLRHAQAQGELDAAADPAVLARIASAVLHTLAIRSRAGDSRASLRATADAAMQLICGTKTVARKKRVVRKKRLKPA